MAFDFTGLNKAWGGGIQPRMYGSSAEANAILRSGGSIDNGGLGHASWKEDELNAPYKLAQMAQEEKYWDQVRRQQEKEDFAKRQLEKEEYAKWEKDQILNQVANQLFQDKKAAGAYGSLGQLSQQYQAAAQEAARRGQGAYANDFMGQAQKLATQEQKAAQDAEKAHLDNAKTQQETIKLKTEAEAKAREGSGIGLIDLKRADDIFSEYTKDSKKQLDDIQVAKDLASQVKSGNPDADVQLNTLLASLYQGSKLSNEDIRRVSQSGSLPQRALNALSKWTVGTPIDMSVDQKVELINSLEKINADKYNQSVGKATGLFKKAQGIPEEIIQDYEGRKYSLPEAPKATGNAPTAALDYLKANPGSAEAFKAKYGFLPEGF